MYWNSLMKLTEDASGATFRFRRAISMISSIRPALKDVNFPRDCSRKDLTYAKTGHRKHVTW